MSIVTRGYGRRTGVIVTWGYGDQVFEIVQPLDYQEATAIFTKENPLDASFNKVDDIEVISFTATDTVEASFDIIDDIYVIFDIVRSQEPGDQGGSPQEPGDGWVDQIEALADFTKIDEVMGVMSKLNELGFTFEIVDGVSVNFSKTDELDVIFEIIVPEEA